MIIAFASLVAAIGSAVAAGASGIRLVLFRLLQKVGQVLWCSCICCRRKKSFFLAANSFHAQLQLGLQGLGFKVQGLWLQRLFVARWC